MLIGHIAEISRFPVKSMAGQTVNSAAIGWSGIAGDRRYAFVRRGNATSFPWFTGRDLSELVLYSATYEGPEDPAKATVAVQAPDGVRWSLQDGGLRDILQKSSRLALDLLQLGVGAHDSMPVSLITTAVLEEFERRHGRAVDRRCLRTNLVVASTHLDRDLLGRRIRLGGIEGGPELLLARPAPRCAMVTIDPDTAQRDHSVLRTIAQEYGNHLATYATVMNPGRIEVGNSVHLVDD